MFKKHITLYLDFVSYLSLEARIQTHTRIAKLFLVSLITLGLVGVFFAVTAAYGKLVLFKDLAAQISAGKHIALYNLMTIALLPAVTETKITLPSGEPVKIGPWFYQSSRFIIKPAAPEGMVYLVITVFIICLPILGLILNIAEGKFAFVDLFAIPFLALGVMMYVHALKRCREDESSNSL